MDNEAPRYVYVDRDNFGYALTYGSFREYVEDNFEDYENNLIPHDLVAGYFGTILLIRTRDGSAVREEDIDKDENGKFRDTKEFC